MVSSILTARLLGPEGKGLYSLLYTTMVLAIAVIAPKPALSQIYFRKKHEFNVLVSNSIVISLLAGLFTALIATLVIPFFYDDIFAGVPAELITLMLVATPIFLFATNMRTMLVADYDIPSATLVKIIRPMFFLLAFGGMAISGLGDLESAVFCILVSVSGMALTASALILKRGYRRFTVDFPLIKDMIAFSLKTHFGMLFRFMQNRFDIFLVAYFLPARDVGIYSVALVVAEVLWRVPMVINNVLLPRLSKESDRKSAEITAKLNRVVFALTFLCLVPFAFLVQLMIPIVYGDDFAEAAQVIVVLLPGVLAISVFKLLAPNLIVRGRAWTYSFSVLVSLLVMVALDVVLIPEFGIIGAAVASSIAYAAACFVVLGTVVVINDLPFKSYFDVRPEVLQVMNALSSR